MQENLTNTNSYTKPTEHKDHMIRAKHPWRDIEMVWTKSWIPSTEVNQWAVTTTQPKWVVVLRDMGMETEMYMYTRNLVDDTIVEKMSDQEEALVILWKPLDKIESWN